MTGTKQSQGFLFKIPVTKEMLNLFFMEGIKIFTVREGLKPGDELINLRWDPDCNLFTFTFKRGTPVEGSAAITMIPQYSQFVEPEHLMEEKIAEARKEVIERLRRYKEAEPRCIRCGFENSDEERRVFHLTADGSVCSDCWRGDDLLGLPSEKDKIKCSKCGHMNTADDMRRFIPGEDGWTCERCWEKEDEEVSEEVKCILCGFINSEKEKRKFWSTEGGPVCDNCWREK